MSRDNLMPSTDRDALQRHFEANLLDGDPLQERGQMLNANDVFDYMADIITLKQKEARIDELKRIATEVGLFTKKRNKFVYNVQLKIKYLVDRLAVLQSPDREEDNT